MPSYVKYETPAELVPKILELLNNAKDGGKIKKGINETTKSIERKMAKLVVMAEDVNPEEIVVHIPMLCEEKSIPFVYVKTKEELGKSIGLTVGTSSVAIEDAGGASEALQNVLKRIPKKEEKKEAEEEPKEEKPKEEKKEHKKEEKKEKPKKERKPKKEKKEKPKKEDK